MCLNVKTTGAAGFTCKGLSQVPTAGNLRAAARQYWVMQPCRALSDSFSPSAPETARRFIDALCNFDVELAASLLCDDSRLSLSTAPCALGKSKVRSAMIRALGAVYWIRCEPAAVWMRRNIAIIEADIECERTDRARVSFPATMILRFRGGLIWDIRVLTYAPVMIGSFPGLQGLGQTVL